MGAMRNNKLSHSQFQYGSFKYQNSNMSKFYQYICKIVKNENSYILQKKTIKPIARLQGYKDGQTDR